MTGDNGDETNWWGERYTPERWQMASCRRKRGERYVRHEDFAFSELPPCEGVKLMKLRSYFAREAIKNFFTDLEGSSR
jgi:hypothetical protein